MPNRRKVKRNISGLRSQPKATNQTTANSQRVKDKALAEDGGGELISAELTNDEDDTDD